jgi:hypothetical protein
MQVKPAGHVPTQVAPQVLGLPVPPHVAGAEHVPQLSVLPQPSLTAPQFAPACAQVRGVQVPWPHTSGVPPPPHVWGDEQVPQSSWPVQPSLTVPQFFPSWAQVRAVHVTCSHWFCALQTCIAPHEPQLRSAEQPSLRVPHVAEA